MKTRVLLIGALLVSAAVATAAPASATAAAPSPKADAVAGPKVEVIPAWATDLPTGQATLAPIHSSAFSAAAAAPWVCTVFAGNPWFNGSSSINASGSQTCSGSGWSPQMVKVTLQKYAGFGIWNNVVSSSSGWTTSNPVSRKLSYACRGTGSEEYRVVTDGYAEYGGWGASVQSQSYVRIYC